MIEVLIASVLIISLITGGTIGIRQLTLLNQVAATRTAHTEIRTQIIEALSETGDCAKNLGKSGVGGVVAPRLVNEVAPISEISVSLASTASKKVAATGDLIDGLRYTFSLRVPNLGAGESFSAGLGRSVATVRHLVSLDIVGERETLKSLGGAQAPVRASIPLSAEFNAGTGELVSCTLHAQDIDEILMPSLPGIKHTVRECLAINGAPIPIDRGVVCRVPVTKMNELNNTPPPFPACPGGWTRVESGGIPYTTTLSRDAELRACRGTKRFVTGWHYLSAKVAESHGPQRIKRGKPGIHGKFWIGAGAAILGGLIGLAIFFILLALSKCRSQSFTVYAQYNGVACI